MWKLDIEKEAQNKLSSHKEKLQSYKYLKVVLPTAYLIDIEIF